jgi:hypothetical protein
MKTYGGVALDGGEWSASRPGASSLDNHWTEGWVDLRAGLDAVE